MKTNRFLSLAAMLCISLFFSCSSDSGSSSPVPSPESSSSSAGVAWNYCVFPEAQACLRGTYYECQSGGLLSNECPYGSSSSDAPSSSSTVQSSSSVVVSSSSTAEASSSSDVQSSSSFVQSSSSAVVSSSSTAEASSSSDVQSSSSIVQSSSSAIPSSSSNITVCKDKEGRYLYCSWGGKYQKDSYGNGGYIVYTNECYALDPEYSDLDEPTCENLVAHCDYNGFGGSAPWGVNIGALYAGPYIEIDDNDFSCKDGGRDKHGDFWEKVLEGPYKLEQIEL